MFQCDKCYEERKVKGKGNLEKLGLREWVGQCELQFQVRMVRVAFIEKVNLEKTLAIRECIF